MIGSKHPREVCATDAEVLGQLSEWVADRWTLTWIRTALKNTVGGIRCVGNAVHWVMDAFHASTPLCLPLLARAFPPEFVDALVVHMPLPDLMKDVQVCLTPVMEGECQGTLKRMKAFEKREGPVSGCDEAVHVAVSRFMRVNIGPIAKETSRHIATLIRGNLQWPPALPFLEAALQVGDVIQPDWWTAMSWHLLALAFIDRIALDPDFGLDLACPAVLPYSLLSAYAQTASNMPDVQGACLLALADFVEEMERQATESIRGALTTQTDLDALAVLVQHLTREAGKRCADVVRPRPGEPIDMPVDIRHHTQQPRQDAGHVHIVFGPP